MFGPLIDCWKDGTAAMAENESHEDEDENSIATPLVLPVREYPNSVELRRLGMSWRPVHREWRP